MKVDRVKLYSLASYIRVRKVTEIRVWFMARQGRTQFLWWPDDGRWQPTDEHDNHSMVTETYLQDTLSAQFKTSQKATNTGFTPALIYSKLQLFFFFFEENTKRLKLIEHSTLASQKIRHVPLLAPGIVCVVRVRQRRWKPLQCSVRNATLVTQGSEAVFSFSRLYVCIHSDVLLYKHFGQGIGSGTSYVCLRWVEGNVVYSLVRFFPVRSNLLHACLAVHVPQADGTIMTCVRQRDITFIFKGAI